MCPQLRLDDIDLKPDDIDVYHGSELGEFSLLPGGNQYVDDISPDGIQVNFVELSGGSLTNPTTAKIMHTHSQKNAHTTANIMHAQQPT